MATTRKERRAKQFASGKPEPKPAVKPGDFSQPHDTALFAASVFALMPKYQDIPDEFKRGHNAFCRIQATWFFEGFKQWPLMPKPGIDHKAAIKHLGAIQQSWEPKHEHKAAAVAYLMSLWYEAPKEHRHKPTP